MSMPCITCGARIPATSEFCPSCGRAVQTIAPEAIEPPSAAVLASGPQAFPASETQVEKQPGPPVAWNERWVAAAAYMTFIPAVAFLFIRPYARRHFVRFHSLQSLLFWALVGVLFGAGVVASTFGFLLLWLFTGTLVVLALCLTWLVLSIKALQGEWFRLPGLGDFARQWAASR
jgi:uncharacterized membrane protein